jgi:hypothetical protein
MLLRSPTCGAPRSPLGEIWPKDAPKADSEKIVEVLEDQIRGLRWELRTAKKLIELPAKDVYLRDMPDSVLDGRLGEICSKRMAIFPVAYAWPALLAVASAVVPRQTHNVRVNLYSALVGPVHSGKSQAIDHAIKILGLESPALMDLMSGSAEALIRKAKDACGNPRLFSPDELGHLLEKTKIEKSSYPYVLNRAYYHDRFEVLMGHCALSIVGGLVTERFEDLFGAATTGGLYDRFVFGLCPGNFNFDYYPYAGTTEDISPVEASIDPEVFRVKSQWQAEDCELNPRIVEHAIRVAAVCAAFDGRKTLSAGDLGPAREFTRYQSNIRKMLKPNPGENFEARLAHKFLDYLERQGGKFVSRRKMFRDTRAYDLGPSVADRALSVLNANGDVALTKVGREELVRLVLDAESEGES